MNYEQANAVKELAPGVNKVLEGLGGLEVECPICKGRGYKDNGLHFPKCKKCNGTGKVKYSWIPQVGQFFLTPDNEVRCIGNGLDLENIMVAKDLNDKYIPILEWEECFEVLVKAGHSAQMDYSTGYKSFCTIKRPGLTCAEIGSNPTEAAYKAILRLGKELK